MFGACEGATATSRTTRLTTIASRPISERIGGNQEFTVSANDASKASLPDAASRSTGAPAYIELWKESCNEGQGIRELIGRTFSMAAPY
jgi:hypothetical protein